MRKARRTTSLRMKIALMLISFSIVPLFLLSLYFYHQLTVRAAGQFKERLTDAMDNVVHSTNEEYMNYIQKSNSLLQSNYYLPAIDDPDFPHNILKVTEFQHTFMANLMLSNDSNQFLIYLERYSGYKGKFIEELDNMDQSIFVRNNVLKASISDIVWKPNDTILGSTHYVTFYRNLATLEHYKGVLEVNIPYQGVQNRLNGLAGSFREELIVRHVKSGLEAKRLVADQAVDHLVYMNDKLIDGSFLVVLLPKSAVNGNYRYLPYAMVGGFLILTVMLLYASQLTARMVTKRLNHFIREINRNDQLLLNMDQIGLPVTDAPDEMLNDEVAVIKRKFISLLRKTSEIHSDLYRVRHENNKLAIELLQSRINPHLLYNSLSVIKWAAMERDDQQTADLIDAMTRYYRIALNKGSDIILVSKELELIELFVQICCFSHSRPYHLDIQVEEQIRQFSILKHLLQPVAENAIVHGLNGKEGDACIQIKGYMENEYIVFDVSDNGHGMDSDTARKLVSMEYTAEYGGYGLRNVIKRIYMHNGSEWGFGIASKLDEGTTVTIRIKAAANESADRNVR